MKNALKYGLIAVSLALVTSSALSQDLQTSITAGYAQSDVTYDDMDINDNPQGFNTKFRYEFDERWGFMSSYTHTQKSFDYVNLYYNSLALGPSVRFNDYASLYAAIGVAWGEAETSDDNFKKTAFAGAVGLQVNPTPNLVFDASYEYSKLGDFDVGTWVIGGGVRF